MDDPDRPFEISTAICNHYLYSYGGVSRFFRELRDHARIMATRCLGCGKVWCPPRTRCAECYGSAEWIALSGEGRVVAATDCYYVPANYELHRYLRMPYVVALIQLDGADTALYNTVQTGHQELHSVRPGDRVRAVFRDVRVGQLTDVYFELAEDVR